jgi:K+-transporting ATPase KdpF subunit
MKGAQDMNDLWLAAILAGGIFIYLVYVLMKPEEF